MPKTNEKSKDRIDRLLVLKNLYIEKLNPGTGAYHPLLKKSFALNQYLLTMKIIADCISVPSYRKHIFCDQFMGNNEAMI